MSDNLTEKDREVIELVAAGRGGDELSDHQFDVLFKHYSDTGEMPYVISPRAQDGDPYQWILARIEQEYNEGRITEMLLNL